MRLALSVARATLLRGGRYVVLVSLVGSCTALENGDDIHPLPEGSDGPDMGASGALTSDPASPWSCVDEAEEERPSDPPQTVIYTTPVVLWVNPAQAVPGLSITACPKIDPQCDQPIVPRFQPPAPAPGAPPNFSIELPGGFLGYLILEAPGQVTERLYLDGPLTQSQTGGRILMIDVMTLGAVAASVGIAIDPTQGLLVMRSHDCSGAVTGGAFFEIDNAGQSYMLLDGQPTRQPLPTDRDGLGGFANVPPGGVVGRGLLADGVTEFGSASFVMLPQTITVADVRPGQ
jgi:hypothetical protein